VVLKTGNSTSLAVPIVSLDQQTPVETNPLGWIASQRKNGKVSFMLKGKKDFIATSLPADTIGEVEAADLPTIIKEKQAEFASRLNRLKNSVLAGNALAWYDAGKFAYRNRLDDQVTEMMDQALLLDHNLVRSVREDKAASLFANVVLHMRNGNQKQADAFMAIIGRRFSDTDQGKQARLFYDGKTSELLVAAKEAEKRRLDDIRERNETRLARAKELNDDKQVQQLQQAVAKVEEPETDDTEPAGPTTTGDEAVADSAFSKGRDLYNQAIDFGNTPERDVYYEKAYNELHKARAIYSRLVEKSPNDEKLQMKLLECNKLHYGSIKQRRFH
jgi:TolA-binding protein